MAAVPVMQTFVTGEIVTAAKLNANVRDTANFLLNVPYFEGRRAAAQALTAGNDTGVALDAEAEDADGMHSLVTATTHVTPQTPGIYDLELDGAFAANATGTRLLQVFFNGALLPGFPVHGENAASSGATYLSTATSTRFNGTTDYFEAVVQSSVSLNLTSARVTATWRRS